MLVRRRGERLFETMTTVSAMRAAISKKAQPPCRDEKIMALCSITCQAGQFPAAAGFLANAEHDRTFVADMRRASP
jgi:hypothetical protein